MSGIETKPDTSYIVNADDYIPSVNNAGTVGKSLIPQQIIKAAAAFNVADKAEAATHTPVAGQTMYIRSADGRGNIWRAVTGLTGAVSDSVNYCGTRIVDASWGGALAWDRDYQGNAHGAWFGITYDNVTNDRDPLQEAVTWSETTNKWVELESGSSLLINSNIALTGGAKILGNFCTINKNFDGIGLTLTGGATFNYLWDLNINGYGVGQSEKDGTAATSGHGIYVNGNRISFRNVHASEHKGNGIDVNSSGNMNRSVWGNGGKVRSSFNDGDGFNFYGTNDNSSIWSNVFLIANQNYGLGIRTSDDWLGRQIQGYIYLEDNAKGGAYEPTDTGSDDTSVSAAFMTDTTRAFEPNTLVGKVITNITTSATATITANTGTTITGTLSAGTWDSGDTYSIDYGYGCANYIGGLRYSDIFFYAEENQVAVPAITKDIVLGIYTRNNELIPSRLNRWAEHGVDNKLKYGNKEQSWNAQNRYLNRRGISMSVSTDYMEEYFQGSSSVGQFGHKRWYGDGSYEIKHIRVATPNRTITEKFAHPYKIIVTNMDGSSTALGATISRNNRGTENIPLASIIGDTIGGAIIQTHNGATWKTVGKVEYEITGDVADKPGAKYNVYVTPNGSGVQVLAFSFNQNSRMKFGVVPTVYADNAAAKTGGLVDGEVYRLSTGELMVVYT